jgi:hypothetical protein
VAAVIAAGFVFSMAASLPGHLSYDSVIQLLEGRAGVYSGWHPPVMSWLLGLGDALAPGAALFVMADALLLFGSLLSILWLAPRVSWVAAAVAGLSVLLPQFLLYPGIVWKDVLFANASIAGFIVLAHLERNWAHAFGRFALSLLALLILTLAVLSRQNGAILLPFAAFAIGWMARKHGSSVGKAAALGVAGLACVIVLAAIVTVALSTRVSAGRGMSKQVRLLEFYDLVGGLAADPQVALPTLRQSKPALLRLMRSDGRRLYSPARSDTLAHSSRLQAALAAAPDNVLHKPWLEFILHRPGLYLRDRAEVFRWVFLTPGLNACVPYVVGLRGPPRIMNELGLRERVSARDRWISGYASVFAGTPIFSHLTYFVLALGELVFLLWRRRGNDGVFVCLLSGALAFCGSFFFVSIACDYRYLYLLDLTALVSLSYLSLDARLARERPVPKADCPPDKNPGGNR